MPISRLQRFGQLLAKAKGEVALELNFRALKQGGTQICGSAQGAVELICQNCMEPYSFLLDCDILFKVVSSYGEYKQFEDDADVILCEQKEINLADLVEDELIMSLPMIARHENLGCPRNDYRQADFAEAVGEAKKTHRPFAGLAAALEKQDNPEN